MTGILIPANLLAWVAQTTVIICVAALLGCVVRLGAPAWRLTFLQVVFAICALLPVIQPWQQPTPRKAWTPEGTANGSPVSTSAEGADWIVALPYLLAAGFGARAIWLCLGMYRLRRLRTNARPLDDLPSSITDAIDLTGASASFLQSDEVASPVTFGFVSPVVLVTPAFLRLPRGQQIAIACHELTHVRRKDWLVSVAEEALAAVLWFHPGVWWLIRQIRLTREQAVDRAVIAATRSRRDYIDALLTMAETRCRLDLSPAPLFLRRRHLIDRIQHLLKEATMTRRSIFTSYLASISVLAAAAWFVGIGIPLTAAPQFEPGPKRIRVDAAKMREKVIHKQRPEYPALAKVSGTQGKVVLAVLVGSDGHVKDLYTMSGPDLLREAAEAAVRNWVYRTTLLNGEPVEVITTVDVNFTLTP